MARKASSLRRPKKFCSSAVPRKQIIEIRFSTRKGIEERGVKLKSERKKEKGSGDTKERKGSSGRRPCDLTLL